MLPDRMGGPATITPEQRALPSAVRLVRGLRTTCVGAFGRGSPTAALNTLSPEQREAVRTIIGAKVADELREGLADQFSD
jgi:hypothetical protein